jgi:hypothetical protein
MEKYAKKISVFLMVPMEIVSFQLPSSLETLSSFLRMDPASFLLGPRTAPKSQVIKVGIVEQANPLLNLMS